MANELHPISCGQTETRNLMDSTVNPMQRRWTATILGDKTRIHSGFVRDDPMTSARRRPNRLTRQLASAELLEPRLMLAAVPQPLAIVAPSPYDLDVAELGGEMFFLTGDDTLGRQLWKTDGSLQGTHVVKDIGTTHNSADVTSLASINGALYFAGPSALWRSDGTTDGTQPLGGGTLIYGKALDVGGHVVFQASDADHGMELWTTDGTVDGTDILKDIYAGSGSSVGSVISREPALYKEMMFFVARDAEHGNEFWRTDGTSEGTILLHDITTGAGDTTIRDLQVTSFGVFFRANNQWWRTDGTADTTAPVAGFPDLAGFVGQWHSYNDGVMFKIARLGNMQLWISDGKAAGTMSIGNVGYEADDAMWELQTSAGIAYFVGSDEEHGTELWRSDGTVAGTWIAVDLAAGPGGSHPHSLTVMGDTLYFIANDGVSGEELWKLTPASNEPTLVRDLAPGLTSSTPGDLVVQDQKMLFTADGPDGRSLWVSDGTGAGTQAIFDPQTRASNRTIYIKGSTADHVLFAAAAPNADLQMWITGGTSESTMPILAWTARSEWSVPISGMDTPRFKNLSDGWLFMANDGIHGYEPWFSDGTRRGTWLVKDIFPGHRDAVGSGDANLALVLDGIVYFAADDGQHGRELWRSDGTSAGTFLLADINEGVGGSAPALSAVVNGALFLAADDGSHGKELWRSDGTLAGTQMVADINPSGDGVGFRVEMAHVGSEVFFRANNGVDGWELWSSDGTAGGTSLVADIRSGPDSSYPGQFAVLDDAIIFLANDGTDGNDLWRSERTSGQTALVADLPEHGSYHSNALLNNQVYYVSSVRQGVPGLWQTDGTVAGTELVKELPPYSGPNVKLVAAEDKLFFVTADTDHVNRLWVSDGSTAGTRALYPPTADKFFWVNPGNQMLSVGSELFFNASGKVWKSDGTDAGTVRVETAPGTFSPSSPSDWSGQRDGVLLFAASHPIYGREAWQLPVAVAEIQLTHERGQVELFMEGDEYVVREADVEIFRAQRGSVSYWEFTGDVQIAELRVDLTAGTPLPWGGISFSQSCCGPERIVLEHGSVQQIDYSMGSNGMEITIDERSIRVADAQHREVKDSLDAARRRVQVLDAANRWQVVNDPNAPQSIHLLETGAEYPTTIELPRDTEELTIEVAADGHVAIGNSIAGLPARIQIETRLGDVNRADPPLGDSWQFVHWGQNDGRVVHEISDGVTEIAVYADGSAWSNPIAPLDVNGNGYVSPQDVLLVITDLNRFGGRSLTTSPPGIGGANFVDVNEDHFVSPIDALLVIAQLNNAASAEGEGDAMTRTTDTVKPFIKTTATTASHTLLEDTVASVTIAAESVSLPPTPLTGFRASEELREACLWSDGHIDWADKDLEEILAELVADDSPWANL